MSPMLRLRRMSRLQIEVTVMVVSMLLHVGWGALYITNFQANADRRSDINALSCAIATDAAGSLKAISSRAGTGLPGDNLLSLNKTRLELAALRLCPNP